ncbi:MAG: hypothetical protein HeimC3_05090 [Candidatus Heimdallarchaeota archaeon LC_3]|nr:MAG: hypothetical protein HeimC3_05090 [Candidatus Heimdallarchaeota archaeon LC_3]
MIRYVYSNYGKKLEISLKSNKIYSKIMKTKLKTISDAKSVLIND